VQPHVQVKLLEFDAQIIALPNSRSKSEMVTTVGRIIKLGNELRELSAHVSDNRTLDTILRAILRADAALEVEIRRYGLQRK
jgi:predicted component of type VI protein secretion system